MLQSVTCPKGHTFNQPRRATSYGRIVDTTCPTCRTYFPVAVPRPDGATVSPGAPAKRDKPVRESQIEARLKQRALALGGEVRKVRWIGRSGAPDRLVMLPGTLFARNGVTTPVDIPQTIWVELKAPGRKPTAAQAREHERMRKMGQRVEVVDSYERIEEILR